MRFIVVAAVVCGFAGQAAASASAAGPVEVYTEGPTPAIVGQELICYPGSWTGSPTITYQWLRGGTPVGSNSGDPQLYVVSAADNGHRISCIATYTYGEEAPRVETVESRNSILVGVEEVPPPHEPPENKSPPKVSGKTEVGSTLTCEPGVWSGEQPISYQYTWLRDGSPIAGAAAQTYKVAAEDVGHTLSCHVEAENAAGSNGASSAGQKISGGERPPADVTPPEVLSKEAGHANLGETLTCSPGTWTGTPEPVFEYQWLRDGTIASASGSTYTVQAEDQRHSVSCRVTARNSAGSTKATSAAVAVRGSKPSDVVSPSITGGELVGDTLTCHQGEWKGVPTPTLTVEWLRNGGEVARGSSTYLITEADKGAVISCDVTAVNEEGEAFAPSENVKVVPEGSGFNKPVNTKPPTVIGEGRLGQTLECSPGTWTENPTGYAYQWFRDGVAISEGTGETYRVEPADEDHSVSCRVTAINGEGGTSANSSNKIEVAGSPPENKASEPPEVVGVARVNQPLTCLKGGWTGLPAPTYEYIWQRGGQVIAGPGPSFTYTTGPQDEGEQISCVVVAKNSGGRTEAASKNYIEIPGAAPLSEKAPEVSGSTTVESQLTCSQGTWGGAPKPTTFKFQWILDGLVIKEAEATRNTYKVKGQDRGHYLNCRVTASNSQGSASATSNAVKIPGVAPRDLIAPSLSGVAGVGGVLTCERGVWEGKPPPSFAYQWYRDDAPVAGATGVTYTVQATDGGSVLSCAVTASNTEGSGEVETSGIAIPVSNAKPLTKGTAGGAGLAGYQSSSGPTVSQLVQALEAALSHLPHSARIRSLLRAGGYSFSFDSLAPGTLELTWTQVLTGHTSARRKPVVIAQVIVSITEAGKHAVNLKLTKSGRRLLQHASSMRITAKAVFSRPTKLPAVWTKTFQLSR